jgi:O-antigen ligase
LTGAALIFSANIVFMVTSRTTVMVFFSFVVIFALQRFRRKGMIGFMVAACAFAALAATLSPYLRARVAHLIEEVQDYEQTGAETSAGFRLEVWKKSTRIIAQAPVIGHGTGSIEEMFRRDAAGRSGLAAVITANPHNQTLAIGIQLGFIGIVALFGMWSAHAMLFCRPGLAAWLGLAVVVQNVVSSLANSPIFDFGSGWIYVFGVGVFGGMILCAPVQGGRSLSPAEADRGRDRADFMPRQ